MTLIDDTCDGCGSRFDPMGDPLLTKHPEIGPYVVFCARCEDSGRVEYEKAYRDLQAAIRATLTKFYASTEDNCHDCDMVADALEALLAPAPASETARGWVTPLDGSESYPDAACPEHGPAHCNGTRETCCCADKHRPAPEAARTLDQHQRALRGFYAPAAEAARAKVGGYGSSAQLVSDLKPPPGIKAAPAHCCDHDSDAHDGAGCLDCACPLGPMHVGYNPTPAPASETAREPHRDTLGRRVREVWVTWAQQQPDPKPTWLVGWDDLPEPDREVDRRIGSALWGDGFAAGLDANPAPTPPTTVQAEAQGSWLQVEYERAKKRNEQIPPHARMVVTGTGFDVPARPTTVQADRDAGQVRLADALVETLDAHDDPLGWTCNDHGMPVYECNCGDTFDALNHDYIEPEDVAAAVSWHRRHLAAAVLAILAARQSDPDATERVVADLVRLIDYWETQAGVDRDMESKTLRGVVAHLRALVRRTVTTGEWTEVGE